MAFDAVIVHCAFAAQYVMDISAKVRIIDFGDLDSGKWEDYAKCKPFPISMAYRVETHKLRRYEKNVAANFDFCTLTTSGELAEFKKLGVARPYAVIPNGVDSKFFNISGRTPSNLPVVVFLGRMDYFPNIDGVVYFATEILPRIRLRIPDAEVRIIGSDPVPEVRKLGKIPGVFVTGHVPDTRPFLRDATVSVAPLRLARGTQNKILESMAMGIPVVATPEAAKGIQAEARKHLLIGNSTESFANEVIKILESPDLRTFLSQSGRKRVEEVHAWSSSMKVLDGILESGNPRGTQS